jgi:hypothetical protein
LTSALVGGEWSASRTCHFIPGYPFYRRLGGPPSRSGRYGEVKIFYPAGTRTLYQLSYIFFKFIIPLSLSIVSNPHTPTANNVLFHLFQQISLLTIWAHSFLQPILNSVLHNFNNPLLPGNSQSSLKSDILHQILGSRGGNKNTTFWDVTLSSPSAPCWLLT